MSCYYETYDSCPLCDSKERSEVHTAPAANRPGFDPSWMRLALDWVRCKGCEHVYTTHHYSLEGQERLFSSMAIATEQPVNRTPRDRLVAAMLIDRVCRFRPVPDQHDSQRPQSWLDIGFGNGAIVATADEYGFKTTGIDTRAATVNQLRDQGYDAKLGDALGWAVSPFSYDVVSLLDVIEHTVHPVGVMRSVCDLVKANGVLVLSTPNMETYDWKALDDRNPYWHEFEHHHIFTRRSIYRLLNDMKFTVLSYSPSVRYQSGMEIIARRW